MSWSQILNLSNSKPVQKIESFQCVYMFDMCLPNAGDVLFLTQKTVLGTTSLSDDGERAVQLHNNTAIPPPID